MSSVAQHLLKGTSVEYERCAAELSTKAGRWCVTDTAGQTAEFDAVVVTAPVPQLLELKGEALETLLAPHREALGRVASRYSQRFAACVYYDEAAWAHFEGLPWASAYVKPPEGGGATSLVYVSIEPRKRQLAPGAPGAAAPALLLHSSVPFGFKNAARSPAEVLPTLLADLDKAVPGLPAPTHAVASRWRVSQVPAPEAEMRGVTGVVPGAEDGALLLQSQQATLPPLVLAGDGFVGSNFDNCARSGRAAATKLVAALFPQSEAVP